MKLKCVLFIVLPFLLMAQSPNPSDDNPNVRVIWGENPSRNAIVSISGAKAELYFDTQDHTELKAFGHTLTPFSTGKYVDKPWFSTGGESSDSYSHFKLDDLKPSTTYFFVVKSEAGRSKTFHFVTAPEDDRPFKLIYGGDSRSDPKARRMVNTLIKNLMAKDSEIIAFVHGGDYNSASDNRKQWQQWLDDYEILVADDGRVYPIIPTRGNHEGAGVSYNQVFGFPAGEKIDYWATKIGKLLWITLDSNVSHGAKQKIFLEKQLKAGQAYRWIVPSYHRPAYPAVKRPGNAFVHWVPLFEKYNVDLVAESDGHVLKRTLPIRNGQYSEDGIVYVGEGGLGVPQRRPDMSRWYLKPPGMAARGHHVQRLSFSKRELLYEAIGLDGKIADSHHFLPRQRGTKSPIEESIAPQKGPEKQSKPSLGLVKTIAISPQDLDLPSKAPQGGCSTLHPAQNVYIFAFFAFLFLGASRRRSPLSK